MTGGTSLWGTTYFLALFAAILALPTSWFLFRRYRRSILRLMNERSSGDQMTEDVGPIPDHPRPTASPHTDVIEAGLRRNVIVVVIVALVSAFAFAALFLIWNEVGLSVWRLSTFGILYSWPAVIGVWIVTGGRRRWVLTSLAVYFVSLGIAVTVAGGSWDVPAQLFLFSLVPTAAIIGFLSRRFRGVGALVLGTMMLALAGSQAFAFTVFGNEVLITAWAEIAHCARCDQRHGGVVGADWGGVRLVPPPRSPCYQAAGRVVCEIWLLGSDAAPRLDVPGLRRGPIRVGEHHGGRPLRDRASHLPRRRRCRVRSVSPHPSPASRPVISADAQGVLIRPITSASARPDRCPSGDISARS